MELTPKQRAAVEFFSRPRTLQECFELLEKWSPSSLEGVREDAASEVRGAEFSDRVLQYHAEQAICDVFLDEMVDLDLRFQREPKGGAA